MCVCRTDWHRSSSTVCSSADGRAAKTISGVTSQYTSDLIPHCLSCIRLLRLIVSASVRPILPSNNSNAEIMQPSGIGLPSNMTGNRSPCKCTANHRHDCLSYSGVQSVRPPTINSTGNTDFIDRSVTPMVSILSGGTISVRPLSNADRPLATITQPAPTNQVVAPLAVSPLTTGNRPLPKPGTEHRRTIECRPTIVVVLVRRSITNPDEDTLNLIRFLSDNVDRLTPFCQKFSNESNCTLRTTARQLFVFVSLSSKTIERNSCKFNRFNSK
jgi:hypothetical protein